MSTMSDADIHAFGATAAARAAGAETPAGADASALRQHAPSRSRRWWPWVLLALALLFMASVVGAAWTLGETLDQALGGLDIRVDGERVFSLPRGEAAWWALGAALLAAMLVMVVVPLALLLALLVTALALGAAVVVVLAVAVVALSPLWALALLLWLGLREPRAARSAPVQAAAT